MDSNAHLHLRADAQECQSLSSPVADYPPLVHLSAVDGLSSCAMPGPAHFAHTQPHALLSPVVALQPPPAHTSAPGSATGMKGVGEANASPTGGPATAFENCNYEPPPPPKPQAVCGGLHPLAYCAAGTGYPTPPQNHAAFYGGVGGIAGVQEAASPGPSLIAPLHASASALYSQQYAHAWAQAQGMYPYTPFAGAGVYSYQPQANLNGLSLSSCTSFPHECRALYAFPPSTCSPPFDLPVPSTFGARIPGQTPTCSSLGGGSWLDNSQVAPSL